MLAAAVTRGLDPGNAAFTAPEDEFVFPEPGKEYCGLKLAKLALPKLGIWPAGLKPLGY